MFQKQFNSVSCKLRRNFYERLRKEWIREADGNAGWCTRLLLSTPLNGKRMGFGNFFKALTGQEQGEKRLINENPAIEDKSIMELASQIRGEVLIKH